MVESFKIVVVDAHSDSIRQLESRLKSLGCRVRTAADAGEGLRCFSEFRPSAVMVDFRMPGAKPFVERIRSGGPNLSIVALADSAAMDQIQKDLKDTVDEYIVTPVRRLDLEIVLRRLRKLSDLQRRIESVRDDPDAHAGDRVESRIARERFTFIKQIARNLSAFMGQIASDAQDGLRYFDEMPYFMAIHSSGRKVLSANPTYMEHFGDGIARDSWEIYTDSRASPDACPVGRTLRTGHSETTRAEVRYRSGLRVPVVVHTAPIFGEQGGIDLILEVFAGAKEIEAMARDIRSTQQRYRQLFDAVPNYIAVLDLQMRLTAFNRRFLEDFGFKTGRKFYDLFKPADGSPDRGPIAGTLEDGLPHHGELTLFSPGGDRLHLVVWTSPITTATGKLIQVLVNFSDVTELRQLQDNLAQLGLMISTVSHSLKGSLTGLDAGLYMIDKGFYRNRPGRIEEGLDVAKLMAERIRKIVRDTLYYAKERELETETVDAHRFAAEVASTLRTKIVAANIRLRFAPDPGAGRVEIDPGLVRTGLINILENAMEACIEDESEKTHCIEIGVNGEKGHVVFSITDNGVGMSSDRMQNIFKQFWSSKGTKGTGLGLFITNKVIQKHGGRITVESKPDQFTAFRVRLPRKVKAQ